MAVSLTLTRPRTLVLESERVRLRPLEETDADAMFLYASDPEVTRYLPWHPATTVDNVRPFLVEQSWRRRKGTGYAFAVILRETGEMIGSVSLMSVRRRGLWGCVGRREAEMGYVSGQQTWGKGLMTEAARLCLQFAFEELRLHRVHAWVDKENLASRRVLEKIGMIAYDTDNQSVKGERRVYVGYEVFR
jgi:ribosomal-protein-alanine N-acetyltransferase